jgi:hypothetical protein
MENQNYFSSFIMHTIEAAFAPGHGISVYKCYNKLAHVLPEEA